MSKKDYTAKNGIFTNYERVDYSVKTHHLSDHAIVMVENEV